MAENRLKELRDHLFDTIQRLKDDTKPMDIDRALAVAEVAQTIVNSARVEVDFYKVTGQKGQSDFLPAAPPPAPALNGVPSPTAAKVKCNQCDEKVLPKELGEHKRTQHSVIAAAAGSQ